MLTPEQLGVFKPLTKQKQRWETQCINQRTFIDYLTRLQEMSLNIFEWKNLPDSVSERFLELSLCTTGMCIYFNDPLIGDLALTCMIGGPLDVYRIPIKRTAYAANGYQAELTNKNSILIFNNYLHTPTMETLVLFSRRLYEIERTIEINVKAQKTPVLITCEESQELTIKNLYAKWDSHEPVIAKLKNSDLNPISVVKTDAPFVADKLEALKKQIWNEAMSFLGIENVVSEKRDRLVSDEVMVNLGGVEAQRYVMLNARREAAKKINNMFGTEIEVDFRNNRGGEGEWPITQSPWESLSSEDTPLPYNNTPSLTKNTDQN